MCTICGHFVRDGEIPSTDIYDMLVKMLHRGPDIHGVWIDGAVDRSTEVEELRPALVGPSHIALGHSRLSIVGREKEGQPFASCDGRLTLIHNGEIYNYQELRSLLQRHHDHRTTSDSEVLVHLLEESYEDDLVAAVERLMGLLDGMYVLAVTDGERLVVARDPVGKKPLYWVRNGATTYFASERKALWNGVSEPRRLDPGDLLVLDDRSTETRTGAELPVPQIDIVDFRQAVDLYKDAIVGAVKKRLAGLHESVLGVIFSGGIDSVLVAQLLQQEGRNVVCYCTGTEGSGDLKAARSVAEDLGLQLKTTVIDEALVEEVLPQVIADVEESGLLQVEVAIPMYLAARLAAEDDIRVMFTGQAADELWAGYSWYTDVLVEQGYLRLHERLWEDLRYLYTDTLEREDKLTMAHSIELRAPYLDRDVIQVAMRTSPRLKIQGAADDQRKRVHRQAAVELGVPSYLAYRIKDPAQSGSGIHGILAALARRGPKPEMALARENLAIDKGSLYRYDLPTYGDEHTRAWLHALAEEVRKRYSAPLYAQSTVA